MPQLQYQNILDVDKNQMQLLFVALQMYNMNGRRILCFPLIQHGTVKDVCIG